MQRTYDKPTNEAFFSSGEHAQYHQPLRPNEQYAFNINDQPLQHDYRYGCDITAIITADNGSYAAGSQPPDTFALIDLRKSPIIDGGYDGFRVFGGRRITAEVEFLLINQNFDPDSRESKGFKGIRRGETVLIGRDNLAIDERFELSGSTSRSHFTLSYSDDGESLSIHDNGSTNGTAVDSAWQLREKKEHGQQRSWRQREDSYSKQDWHEKPRNDHSHKMHEPQEPKLDPVMQGKLDDLKEFIGNGSDAKDIHIDDNMLLGLLRHIGTLRKEGVDNRKIRTKILKNLHPDKFANSPAEQARNNVMYKAAEHLLRRET